MGKSRFKTGLLLTAAALFSMAIIAGCSDNGASWRVAGGGGGIVGGADTEGDNSGPDFPIVPNAQYIRGQYFYGAQPDFTVISSRYELDQYNENTVIRIYGNDGRDIWQHNSSFLEATAQYDDDYFANNFLIIAGFVETSGSIRHKVERIDENGEVHISRLLPSLGTDDMASWSIVIELDNKYKGREYRAVVVNVNMS